jgi:hypothetical protein
MYSDDYYSEDDECDDGRRQLEEYEWHCEEVQRKATALVTHTGAVYFATLLADAIFHTVQEHATLNDKCSANLEVILAGTVAEIILTQAIEHHPGALQQPLTRSGFIELRQRVDAACIIFEEFLAVDSAQ